MSPSTSSDDDRHDIANQPYKCGFKSNKMLRIVAANVDIKNHNRATIDPGSGPSLKSDVVLLVEVASQLRLGLWRTGVPFGSTAPLPR